MIDEETVKDKYLQWIKAYEARGKDEEDLIDLLELVAEDYYREGVLDGTEYT